MGSRGSEFGRGKALVCFLVLIEFAIVRGRFPFLNVAPPQAPASPDVPPISARLPRAGAGSRGARIPPPAASCASVRAVRWQAECRSVPVRALLFCSAWRNLRPACVGDGFRGCGARPDQRHRHWGKLDGAAAREAQGALRESRCSGTAGSPDSRWGPSWARGSGNRNVDRGFRWRDRCNERSAPEGVFARRRLLERRYLQGAQSAHCVGEFRIASEHKCTQLLRTKCLSGNRFLLTSMPFDACSELGRKIFRTDGLYQHVLEFDGGDVPPYAKVGLQDAVRRRERALEVAEEIEMMQDGEWDGFGPSPAELAQASGAANVTEAGIGIRDSADMQATEFVAVNLIRVLLFNVLPMSIVLVGVVTRLDAEARAAVGRKSLQSGRAARMQGGSLEAELPSLTPNTVRVDFAPPIIAAGSPWLQRLFKLSVGPSTDVFLDTTFVDAQLRLGRGATSGSRFVFKRVSDENRVAAESWQGLVDKSAPPALPVKLVGEALKWFVLARILATAAAFYLADPVTVKVLCHGAGPSVVGFLVGVGEAARGLALSGLGAWVRSLALLAVAWAVSKAGGGIVRGEERSA